MGGTVLPSAVLAVCTVLTLLVAVRRSAVPVWASLLIALALRVGFAAVTSRHYTPNDVGVYFHSAGALVLHGRDPLSHLPGRQWNFLELMPYVFALEIKSGLAWVYAVKIAPIAADVVVAWLVSRLADSDSRSRCLQYALNPVSLLVVSLHGQVEPVALALALGGLLGARHGRWLAAGTLLGAAVAAKTWPAVILLAVLPVTRPREAAKLLAGAVVVPFACLASGTVLLDAHPVSAVKHILSYTSFVDNWGWAGMLVTAGFHHAAGYGSRAGHIGSLLVAVAVAAVLIGFRDRPAAPRAAACLLALLAVTAGFGNQYLLWPLPLLFAVAGAGRLAYTAAAGFWAGVAYLARLPAGSDQALLTGLSWLVIASLSANLLALYRAGAYGRSRHVPDADAELYLQA